jgi:transcriptional regulator with XRE-family HTH domain
VEDPKIVQRNLALQREWYGEPLGDRVRRLVRAFNISQAYLADVLGISAPMLSQVMSGRRAKIGNPSVLARMIMLERKVFIPDVAAGDPDAMKQAMEDVKESRPTVGRDVLRVDATSDANAAVDALRNILTSDDLLAAAELVDEDFPELGDLLRRAGERPAEDGAIPIVERRPAPMAQSPVVDRQAAAGPRPS